MDNPAIVTQSYITLVSQQGWEFCPCPAGAAWNFPSLDFPLSEGASEFF